MPDSAKNSSDEKVATALTALSKNKKADSMSSVFILLMVGGVIGLLLGALSESAPLFVLGIAAIVIGFVGGILFLVIFCFRFSSTNTKLANGEWPFPAEEFCKDCKRHHVTAITDEYSLCKATVIAEQLCEKYDIPPRYQAIYVAEDVLKGYFTKDPTVIKERLAQSAKKLAITPGSETLDSQTDRKEEGSLRPFQSRISPSGGFPDKEQQKSLKKAADILKKTGREKRIYMICEEIHEITEKRRAIYSAPDTLRKTAQAIRLSAYQEQKIDWAVAGGIAEGIAGPGAGVSAAIDAMKKNEQIEARNAANQKQVNELALEFEKLIPQAEKNKKEYERYQAKEDSERLDLLKSYREEAPFKAVLTSATSEMLENALLIKSVKATKGDNFVTTVELEVANTYSPRAPKGVRMVVDGTLVADVYCGERVMETVSFPLPILGIEYGDRAILKGYFIEPVVISSAKDLKIKNSSLWIMER